MPQSTKSQDILNFWFTETSPDSWFKKDTKFDFNLKERYGRVIADACSGRLDSWADNYDGCLALIILLDQFSRNIFRHSARAFSGDEMALALSLRCVDRGYLSATKPSHSQFMLMPMAHSEDLTIQDASLPLFKKYTSSLTVSFANKHRNIIAQFGRFPHRNEALGRPNTPAEKIFLAKPGSSF